MRKLRIIFFTAALLIFAGHTSFAQADSAKLKQKNTESTTNVRAKNGNGFAKQQGNNQKAGGMQEVKQVKGARPDMSKARGARPPDIVRPSGSGIPRGMGKPGGAFRHGGR